MATRNRTKYDTQLILDFNIGKVICKVETIKKDFMIDINAIKKDENDEILRAIKAYRKKGEEANPTQYSNLLEARVYRKITYHLAEYFKQEIKAKGIDVSKIYLDLYVVKKWDKGNAVYTIEDIETVGIIKQFFSGCKGIGIFMVEKEPQYNVKMKN